MPIGNQACPKLQLCLGSRKAAYCLHKDVQPIPYLLLEVLQITLVCAFHLLCIICDDLRVRLRVSSHCDAKVIPIVLPEATNITLEYRVSDQFCLDSQLRQSTQIKTCTERSQCNNQLQQKLDVSVFCMTLVTCLLSTDSKKLPAEAATTLCYSATICICP